MVQTDRFTQRGVQVNIWGRSRGGHSVPPASLHQMRSCLSEELRSLDLNICVIDLIADAVQLERKPFPSFNCSQRRLSTFGCYSIIYLLQKNKCHCHVSAILTPVGNGSTIMIDGSAQVCSHGNGHQCSTLEDQLVLQVLWFWILAELCWTHLDPLNDLMIFSWSPQRSLEVNRVLPSHFNTAYFYGLSGSCWRPARLFDCGARYLLLWGSYGTQTFASTSRWIQQNEGNRKIMSPVFTSSFIPCLILTCAAMMFWQDQLVALFWRIFCTQL